MISRHQRPQADSRHSLRLKPVVSSLLAALALSGCATNQTGEPQSDRSPLMVYTSVGSNQPEEAKRFPADTETRHATRPRRLQPVQARPTFDDDKPQADTGAKPGARTTQLNFKEADLQGVVRALAQFTGRNFVVDQRVRGKLTLVSDTPVDADTAYSMLLAALRMQGFAVVEVDGVSRVVPEADAKLLGGPVATGGKAAAGGELVTRVFPLHYEKAADLLPVLRPLIPPNNTITAQAGNNALVITDYASNLDRIAKIIRRVDTPMALNTDVIPIEYGVALDVAALAQRLLQDDQGRNDQQFRILADARSNSVLVRASTPERLKLVRDLILRIDAPGAEAGNLHVVYLRNAQASHLAEVLRGALTGRSNTANSAAGAPLATTSQPSQQHATSAPSSAYSTRAPMQTSLQTATQAAGGMSQTPLAEPQQAVSFSASGATVQADPTTNTLIISAPDPLYRSLRQVIDELDQRRAQVLIESLIVEVNADNAAELGVQWMAGSNGLDSGHSSFFGGANLGGTGIGANTNARTTIDALGSGLSLGVVNGTVNVLGSQILNLSVLARALKQRGGVNVLSTPNLMTLDNEEASIIVGRTVPFVTGSYTTSGDGASNPFQTVQREDVGLTLRIRPQITEGGTVKLALYQEVSSIDPSSSLTSGSIITRKRALQTNVLVDNGQIIVLGGLLEDEIDDSDASVPLLGDIPVLGNLFKYRKRSHTKTNLMLFLRPHIVRTARESAGVTLDRYNYMRALQNGQPSADSWLLPASAPTTLPSARQDPRTGLIDLRGPVHGTGAPGVPPAPQPQAPAPRGTPAPAGSDGTKL